MSDTDWLSSILKDFDTWCLCGNKECGLSENYKEAEQAILNHIDKAIGRYVRAKIRKELGIKEGE